MKLITGHDLRTGEVRYWTGERTWAAHLDQAARFDDEAADAEAVQAKAQPTIATNIYLVAIDLNGKPVAREYLRESIRASGPTVRRDLGKQAERAR